nr:hypothetical protein [Pseudophaeobacter leonis]
MRRDGVCPHHAAKLIAAPGKDLALAVQQGDRAACAPVKQIGDLWQFQVLIAHSHGNQRDANHPNPPAEAPDQPQQPAKRRQQGANQPTGFSGWPFAGFQRRFGFGLRFGLWFGL